MSQPTNKPEPKQKKPKANDETQKNTQAWQQKQQLKKEKKTEKQQTDKPQKKQKKNKNKEQKQQEKKQKTIQQTSSKAPQKKVQTARQEKPQTYDILKTVQDCIIDKNPQLRSNRGMQEKIIVKSMNSLLNDQDTVLLAGNIQEQLICQQIFIERFNKAKFSEIVTRYEDIAYFFDHRITKIFIEANIIFQNGSILAKRGTLNLVLMAHFNNVPVIAHGGSWNYCGFAPIDHKSLEEKYGPSVQEEYDWITVDLLTSIILEVGNTLPIELQTTINYIYRGYPLHSIQW